MSRLARTSIFSISLIVLLAGGWAQASAQEIGIEYGVTRAGYDDALERPTGVSGFLNFPVSTRFAIRFTAAHHTESPTIIRSPCTGLVPPSRDCTAERFLRDARLTTYGVGVAIRLASLATALQPELYALGIGSYVDANFEGQNSEARLQPITPDGLSVGVAFGGA